MDGVGSPVHGTVAEILYLALDSDIVCWVEVLCYFVLISLLGAGYV